MEEGAHPAQAGETVITQINGEMGNPAEVEPLRAALDTAMGELARAPLEHDTRDLEDAVERAQKALSERLSAQGTA